MEFKQINKKELKKENRKFNWVKLLKFVIVISSMLFYIAFAAVWEEKLGSRVLFGDFTSLLFGIIFFSIGVLMHTYILHNFKAIPWIISFVFCLVGTILCASIFSYAIGIIFLIMLTIEAAINKQEFKNIKKNKEALEKE